MAAPIGNQNAAKAKVWTAAIERALAQRSKLKQKEALDELAEALLQRCQVGDMQALKELGDRLEGRATQVIEGAIDLNHRLLING